MALTVLRGLAGGVVFASSPVLEPGETDCLVAADTVLGEALEHARALTERAHTESERVYREAFAAGFEAGRAAAAEAFVVTAVEQSRRAEALEAYVLRAVLVGIRNVIGELPADERMRRLVHRAIGQVPGPGDLTMHVNPDDAAAAREAIAAFREGGLPAIRVVADARLGRGACRIDGESGSIEAGLDVQLEAIGIALAAVAAERGLGDLARAPGSQQGRT